MSRQTKEKNEKRRILLVIILGIILIFIVKVLSYYGERFILKSEIESKCYEYYKNEMEFTGIGIDEDEKIVIAHGSDYITIGDIAEFCPEISRLSVDYLNYESKKDFEKFENLRSVKVWREEMDIKLKNYILELFPECEIE